MSFSWLLYLQLSPELLSVEELPHVFPSSLSHHWYPVQCSAHMGTVLTLEQVRMYSPLASLCTQHRLIGVTMGNVCGSDSPPAPVQK